MAQKKAIRGRFAPSPSGRMHLGNLFAALLSWLDTRSLGGELLLRMEDLDRDRCRPDYAERLLDDLRWLGLDWDIGFAPGEKTYLQSERRAHYQAAFDALHARELIYPCYCSRKERLAASAPHASDGGVLYDGRCRGLTEPQRRNYEAAGRRPAWRIRMPHEWLAFRDGNFGSYGHWLDENGGDFILRRSDGVWAYQLAVVVDDGLMGVSRVVRGADLLSATPGQLWLFRQLGFTPPDYAHTPLLTDTLGRRLSKRDRDMDVGVLRQNFSPELLTGYLAQLAGLIDRAEPIRPAELIAEFSWAKIGRNDRVAKLPESVAGPETENQFKQ